MWEWRHRLTRQNALNARVSLNKRTSAALGTEVLATLHATTGHAISHSAISMEQKKLKLNLRYNPPSLYVAILEMLNLYHNRAEKSTKRACLSAGIWSSLVLPLQNTKRHHHHHHHHQPHRSSTPSKNSLWVYWIHWSSVARAHDRSESILNANLSREDG